MQVKGIDKMPYGEVIGFSIIAIRQIMKSGQREILEHYMQRKHIKKNRY